MVLHERWHPKGDNAVRAAIQNDNSVREAVWKRLEEIVSAHCIEGIAEEGHSEEQYVGKMIADAHGLQYENILMPLEERERQGITSDYNQNEATKHIAYQKFEAFFFEQGLAMKRSLTNLLVIVGGCHRERVARRFAEVETENVLTEQLGPFDPDLDCPAGLP